MPRTVGELRARLVEMGDKSWSIAAHLADHDPLPTYGLGGDLSQFPLAADVPALDLQQVIAEPAGGPVLRARRLQIADLNVQVRFLPDVDWRNRWGGTWLATIQAQGGCDNCWAFAAAGLVESMVRIEHGAWSKRSEGDIRDGWGGKFGEDWRTRDMVAPCAHGAGVSGALDWIVNNGAADPDCFPWSSSDLDYAPTPDRPGRTTRIPKYTTLGSAEDVKKWLDAVGPVVAGFDFYDDFGAWGGPDVYHLTPGAVSKGSHVVLLVGYDDSRGCWILRNSWGPTWGEDGYGLFGYGECNIDKHGKYGLQGTNPDPWTRRRMHNGCLIESGNGAAHRNFEMLRSSAPRARHLWRQGGENGDFSWHEAAVLEHPTDAAAGAGVLGMPALTSTTYSRNFEAVYWELSGYLRHWWFDQTAKVWNDGGRFGDATNGGYPGFIQSDYGAPGNFEVVVRSNDGHLRHWWREGGPTFAWHDGGTITSGVKMSGPSLVEGLGKPGHFYVVAVMNTGEMQLWWRDNANGAAIWKAGEVFGSHVGDTPACMIQGEFGAIDELTPGNFELCVAVGGKVEHWWRDNSAIRSEPPHEEAVRSRLRDRVDAEQSPLVHAAGAGQDQKVAAVRDRVPVVGRASGRLIDEVHPGLHDMVDVQAAGPLRDALTAALGSAVIVPDYPGIGAMAFPERWHRSGAFGADIKHVWGLLQGSFGFNLEMIVERTDGALVHWYRDGEGWHEGESIDV